MKSEEVKALIEALDDLIELKTLFRKTAPTYKLDEGLETIFLSLLKSLSQKLQPIFKTYLKDDHSEDSNKKVKERILEVLNAGNYALISSSSSKKKLKSIGIDPRNLIVSGGPLFFEDYKKINPNLPEKALIGIKKKCENLINEVKNLDLSKKGLFLITEANNPTDQLIRERIGDFSALVGKFINQLILDSWKDLDL